MSKENTITIQFPGHAPIKTTPEEVAKELKKPKNQKALREYAKRLRKQDQAK